MIFCDTSAAVKQYVPELESSAMRSLLASADGACLSDLCRVEIVAAFHRRLREGFWSREQFHLMMGQFASDDAAGFWTWLPLDRAVLLAAASTYAALERSVFLRSSDCIHLCTAIRHKFKAVHTYDVQQAKGAAALGLEALTA